MSSKKALVVLSGGQDSTTCLYQAIADGADLVCPLTFWYAQRHEREIKCAQQVVDVARNQGHPVLPLYLLRVDGVLESTSPLVNQNTAVEHYTDAASLPGGLEKTFVPGRNMLFLALAANRAYAWGCNSIYMGVCEEDFGGYPDCREDFIQCMEAAIDRALFLDDDERSIEVITPLMHMTKKESVLLAARLPGCMEALAYTHTCYEGKYPPCGTCHSCLLRARGFAEAGIEDPLIRYRMHICSNDANMQ